MQPEAPAKRAVAFFDGQNLFHAAKAVFGSRWPDYDPQALATRVCSDNGWALAGVRHYTGIPSASDDPKWNHFWNAKQAAMGTRGVYTFGRALVYRDQEVVWPDGSPVLLPDGTPYVIRVPKEKGIDIRLALDVVSLAVSQAYDVAILFTQDQDLTEAVDEVKAIARLQRRWVTVACAYPFSATPADPRWNNGRGVNRTNWIKLDSATYTSCKDPKNYLPTRTITMP